MYEDLLKGLGFGYEKRYKCESARNVNALSDLKVRNV